MFKEFEFLNKNFQVFEQIRKQTAAFEQIRMNVPTYSFHINSIKSIYALPKFIFPEYALINNQKTPTFFNNNYELFKIHKSSFNYINFHKDIVKSFPTFPKLFELNCKIQSLNLNLPYVQLKNTPGWDAYQSLNHIFNNFSPLIDSINKNFIMNNILINDSSIYSWLETLKTNREIMLSFNAFKNSDLGLELSSDLKSIEEKPHLTHRERQILFFIFIGFTISFQYPDLSLKIFQIAEDFFNELNNFKPLAAFGTYCTLKESAQKFKSFIEDSQSFANEIDF